MEKSEKVLNHGVQPIDAIMTRLNLDNHDLVAASTEQITHKMVKKARVGRFLTRRVQIKIVNALNSVSGEETEYFLKDLFNY